MLGYKCESTISKKETEHRFPNFNIKWMRGWSEALGSIFFIFTDNICREISIDDYTSDEFYNPCTNDTTYDEQFYYRIIKKRGDMFLEMYNNYDDGNELWKCYEIKNINDKQLTLIQDNYSSDVLALDYKLEKNY